VSDEGTEASTDPFVEHGPRAAVALVLLALVLRLRGISEYWLNPDEGIYYSTLTRDSLGAFWAEIAANAHPPLFYVLLRGMGALTWDFVWLRGAMALFGALAVWALWLVGRELGGRGREGVVAGLVAAGLLAVSGEAIVLSQVIRPYAMVLALLALALYHVLRYRRDPSSRRLLLYTACIVTALLTHYSAALAFGALCVVVGFYRVADEVQPAAWRRLALAQAVPALVFGALYLRHVASTIDSDLMGDALGPNGWLSPWLVSTPTDVWNSFAMYQVFHLPPEFRGRAALLLLTALGFAAARNRLVAVVAGGALAAALSASFLGLYPFGPSRHVSWLIAFTVPALAWLVGHLVDRGPRAARVGAAVLAVALLAGGPLEGVFGVALERTNTTEEQVVRRADLAPLVVRQMAPDGEPRTIVMTEQSYNLLMPLYADQREDADMSPDSTHFGFTFGRRAIVVARTWDWDSAADALASIEAAPSVPAVSGPSGGPVLLVVGGWGSGVFSDLPRLQERGALLETVPVLGEDARGRRIVRMMGMVVDPAAMREGT
jgi:hypothetical protein